MTDKEGLSSNLPPQYGYNGKIIRVDLTTGAISSEELDEATLRKYIGGAALGIKYIFDEVPPESDWSSPENRLFLGTGPLGGTRVGGSGSIAVVTKGALTNGMASSQANGFFGTFLRHSGFDAIIIQGVAPEWVYLHIHDGTAELRDARSLVGKVTPETESAVKQELQKGSRQMSVLGIGPAGENLVRFACVITDNGHVAAHNGIGAVMGSKKLKAIAVDRGKNPVPVKDKETLSGISKELLANALTDKMNASTHEEGTVGGVVHSTPAGMVPVKNYTTNVFDITPEKLETYTAKNIRGIFNAKPHPCWACTARHCHMFEVPDGKYAGRVIEEPEYEGMSAFSSLVGITDVKETVLLTSEVDRLGVDINESGWVLAFTMDCYEKGILTIKDTDGLEMTWGNGEAIMAMLNKIARREGIGDILAEGVMRAARHIGGEAVNMAIHTMKGNTPRGHDHRVMWQEMFDTCVSNLGTLESHTMAPLKALGLPPQYDKFDPEVVSTVVATIKGSMVFEDSLVTCRFNTLNASDILVRAVNAVTGWDMDLPEAMRVGKRAVNLARVFNLRAGIGVELDRPSPRYGSTLPDGVMAGKGIMPHWEKMLKNYYRLMGWDENTGKPLPETLKALGLDAIIPQLSAIN
jgi:aldehyde:ferredoxin oxidoreductase